MTEEEKIIFWGDLDEPITALLGGLLGRGEYKLVDVVMDIVSKAESAVLEEREACAKLCEEMANWHSDLVMAAYEYAAETIRARGQG